MAEKVSLCSATEGHKTEGTIQFPGCCGARVLTGLYSSPPADIVSTFGIKADGRVGRDPVTQGGSGYNVKDYGLTLAIATENQGEWIRAFQRQGWSLLACWKNIHSAYGSGGKKLYLFGILANGAKPEMPTQLVLPPQLYKDAIVKHLEDKVAAFNEVNRLAIAVISKKGHQSGCPRLNLDHRDWYATCSPACGYDLAWQNYQNALSKANNM